VAGIDVLGLAWRREPRRWIAATMVTAGLMFVTVMGHRWLTYGAFAPNTYFAKVADGGVAHVWLGLTYVGTWMLAHAVVLVFVVIGAVAAAREHDRRAMTAAILLVVYTF